jgi:formyl-CoA transferase
VDLADKILGRPELGKDPRYEDRRDRVLFGDEIDAMITAWTETRPKHSALDPGRRRHSLRRGSGFDRGLPIRTCARPAITDLEHPRRGVYPMPGNPVKLADSPTDMVRAPLLGEHNAEVLGKLLGCSEADIEALRRDGVI